MPSAIIRMFLAVAALLTAVGCAGVDTSRVTADAVVPLDRAPLDRAAGKRIVGIGEATHGNKEFVEIRLALVQRLVREHGFRTLALEADFGGTATADDYVRNGRGTAERAAKALGFDVYRTRETADLLAWLHEHNAGVPRDEQVRLYGFDMQRYDQNKRWLLRYLTKVDPAEVTSAEKSLAPLTDATRSTQDEAKVEAGERAARRLMTRLEDDEKAYVAKDSADAFTRAVHHAQTIQRGAALQLSGNDYARKRDAWMAQNVEWIVDHEADQGREKIVLGGHNGHIEKTGAAYDFASMGERLTAKYGDGYFTVGTEFGTSTFVSADAGSGERRRFTVSHDTPLAKLFGDERSGYVDIARASERAGNRELLASEVRMGSVGDSFRSIYGHLRWSYTVPMVPAKAYDALVYVPQATPVTPL
ncbi:MAG: erythromycin esterase family protein [Streptosporangiales bacterium]|nr:erythromycin esterase family protein [Streptosporangiales bacterium]